MQSIGNKRTNSHILKGLMSDKTRPKKKWVPPLQGASGFLENGVLEKIGVLLKEESLDEISQFLSKGFGNQVLQSWSYYAQVNDHRKFTSSTITLTKLMGFIGGHNELSEYGLQLIKDILTSYIKTIYRGLNSMRSSLTNPTVKLLNEVVLFQNGALIDDFVALFDFTLPVLPKLLNPSKSEQADIEGTKEKESLSMRYCFIRFLLNLLKYSAPLLRKELLTNNNKIMINWFKYISIMDSDNLINLTISVWDEKIIREPSFKKVTKIKVFNEWNISKLLPIYYTKDKEIRSTFDKFILSLATDSKYGLRFNDDESWFLPTTGSGTVSVNGKNFKIHNKLLYALITNLKPWDDDLQLNTTIEILKSSPELIPPFMNYLASRGLHDPKLSSYWLGQTLLLSKVINLDTPSDIYVQEASNPPSTNMMIELIVPSVINRAVLARCLVSESFLIRQLSAQLIVNSIQKLEKLLEVYAKKSWSDQKIQLLSKARLSLPEISTVMNSLSDSYTKKSENKILLLTLLSVINGYMKLFSETLNFSQNLSKPYSDIINEKEFKSIDFVLLDNFFQLQEGNSSQLKWWNKTDNSTSLFTSLLKLSSSTSTNSAVSSKIAKLLSGLVKQTVIFNHETAKADPIELLVVSLQLVSSSESVDDAQLAKIWQLLDESVSRCVRAPFKYLDTSNELLRASPVLVTIFEQWKFVDKETPYDLVSKWFAIFLRFLVIAGEPVEAISKLVQTVDLDCQIYTYLPSTSYEKDLQTLPTDSLLKVEDNSSFFETITAAPLSKIQNSSKLPTSHLDIVGALFRITKIFNDDMLKLNERGLERTIVEILSKLGNYLIGNPEATKEFSKRKYWDSIFITDKENEKTIFMSSTLAEIFSQLPDFDTTDIKLIINDLIKKDITKQRESIIAACSWALDEEVLLNLLDRDSLLLKLESLSLLLERGVSLKSSKIAELVEDAGLVELIKQFVARKLVIFDDITLLLSSLSKDKARFGIFQSLSYDKDIVTQLLDFITTQSNLSLITYVASCLPKDLLMSMQKNDGLTQAIDLGKSYALARIKDEDFETISFPQLLQFFSNFSLNIPDADKQGILSYALTTFDNKYIQEVANVVQAFNCFQDDLVRTWINKSVLYLTKVFAEFDQLSTTFKDFLKSFKSLLLKSGSTQVVNKSNLNTLLEVILTKWPADEMALELAAMTVVVSSKSALETNKLLQIFIANDGISFLKKDKSASKSRFLSALILWRLFEFDVTKNASVSLQDKILEFYGGSNSPEDLLLYAILERTETRLNSSWIDSVYTWDFLDSLTEEETELIGESKLIEKKKEGFIVTLNRTQIKNTIKNYNVTSFTIPSMKANGFSNWSKIETFYKEVECSTIKDTYDPLFLSLLIINNDELITISTEEDQHSTKANLRKLIESDILALLLLNLSSENQNLLNVTLAILSAILHSLKTNSTFKDKHIFELLLSKIVYTFAKTKELGEKTNPQDLSPLIYALISKVSIVLNNPGHFLYEKAFRWVLKSPVIRPTEIPLFNEIATSTTTLTNDDTGSYYKQLNWLIEGFVTGVKSKKDLQLLRNKNVFEWILNLQNSPYAPSNLKFLILDFIHTVQNIEDGADVLIARYGGLANIEQKLASNEFDDRLVGSNNKSAKNQQEALNLKELGLRYAIMGENKKRLADWTQGDMTGFSKRLHTSHI